MQKILQTCSNYILIPNWYTKEDFEELTNSNFSNRAWEKLLSSTEEYSTLIDETNAMTVSWFENNVSKSAEKVSYSMSAIEDSDESDEESSYSDDSSDNSDNSDNSDTQNLLENDDSDEESDNESDDELNKEQESEPINNFIVKQLEKLKYSQLKKIAGVKSNRYSKDRLIELITKDCNKLSIIKALNFVI